MRKKIMKEIYLVRHGQTDFNKLGIVQGSGVDADLNETGQQQAAAFFETYQHIDFDKIYTSTLRRTWQSVNGFIQKGIAWEKHSTFNEISWGVREGTPFSPEEDAYYRWLIKSWNEGKTDIAIDGGESPNQVAVRQQEAIEILKNTQEKRILVCMHGRALRILLCQLTGKKLTEMESFGHHNLGLYLLHYDNQQFEIVKNNDITHLAAIKTY
jgi:probable phosphoglycerate mutase